jgi:hypothetical protein
VFLLEHGSELFDIAKNAIHSNIWESFVEGDKAFDRDFLRQFPELSPTRVAGWYLIFMWNDSPRTRDLWYDYVGQSIDLQRRRQEHFRAAEKGKSKSLIYELWRGDQFIVGGPLQNTVKFIPLGTEPPTFRNDAQNRLKFLNIVETFLGVVFQTFQPLVLKEWLDKSVAIRPGDHGANITVPVIEEFRTKSGLDAWLSLWKSDDPRKVAIMRAVNAKAHETLAAQHYKSQMAGKRVAESSRLWQLRILRGPVRDEQETVPVYCSECGTEKIDHSPAYATRTGEYVARFSMCTVCPAPARSPEATGSVHSTPLFLPVEKMPRGFVRYYNLVQRLKRPHGCQLYYGKDSLPSDLDENSDQAPEFAAAGPSSTLGGSNVFSRSQNQYWKDGILRDADPTKGEPESVDIKCPSCHASRPDEAPAFLSYTGQYVLPAVRCSCGAHNWSPVDASKLPEGKFQSYKAITGRLSRNPLLKWEYTPPPLRSQIPPKANPSLRGKHYEEGILRDPIPDLGEPDSVELKCRGCGHLERDAQPLFLSHTGAYLVSGATCRMCKKRSFWAPVDVTSFVARGTFLSWMKDPMNAWEHTPKDLRAEAPPNVKPKNRGSLFDEGILQPADPGTSVKLRCRGCGVEGLDSTPLFLSLDGRYAVTATPCSGCKRNVWDPVDVPKGFIAMPTLHAWMRDPVRRWEFTPKDLRGPKPAPAEKPAKKPTAKTPVAKKPAAKKRLSRSRDEDDDDYDEEDEVPRKKSRS